ncbi:MAG: M13 family metallopeptidase [Myxococcota bacterium]|nr:M13 family metallopeptidase [Myxococcota bacterium]
MKFIVSACSIALLTAGCAHQSAVSAESSLESGLELENFDKSIRPQDDLYRFANGRWLSQFDIPSDRSNYGSFSKVADEAEQNLKNIVQEIIAKSERTVDEEIIANIYQAFMNTEGTEAAGLTPLKPIQAKIDAATSHEDIGALFGEMMSIGVSGPLVAWIGPDSKNTKEYIVNFYQYGLGLPDRDFYLADNPQFDGLRAAYLTYLTNVGDALGFKDPAAAAQKIYDLEKSMASIQWTRVESRNRDKTYNKFAPQDFLSKAGDFPWEQFALGTGLPSVPTVIVYQPSYIESFAKLFRSTDISIWKSYINVKAFNTLAPRLSDKYVNLHFDFYGKMLSGTPEIKPRWKRALNEVEAHVGEILGKLYVERHFKSEAKTRMDQLVQNLISAFDDGIDSLEWMSDVTKVQAKEKLQKFTPKIGYPDIWKSYSALKTTPTSIVENYLSSAALENSRELAKLGAPVNRHEWYMTPQTVNAYYNPSLNEIVFPAAILQPPFFNLAADDAVNYGGIGAVIGHELSHGFDDQGRKSDGDGLLRDWWTEEDAKKFQESAQKLVMQYDGFKPFEDANVNGKFTLGENIGDLGGLTIAYRAYMKSLGGKPAPIIDGFTGEQRFFLGWAQVWGRKYREAELRKRLVTDSHSPSEYRANGVVANMPEFYQAFGVKEGDELFLPETERVKIW